MNRAWRYLVPVYGTPASAFHKREAAELAREAKDVELEVLEAHPDHVILQVGDVEVGLPVGEDLDDTLSLVTEPTLRGRLRELLAGIRPTPLVRGESFAVGRCAEVRGHVLTGRDRGRWRVIPPHAPGLVIEGGRGVVRLPGALALVDIGPCMERAAEGVMFGVERLDWIAPVTVAGAPAGGLRLDPAAGLVRALEIDGRTARGQMFDLATLAESLVECGGGGPVGREDLLRYFDWLATRPMRSATIEMRVRRR